MSMTKPAYLYKYEAFTTQSLENLKSQMLFFGSPQAFNDPYDCNPPLIKREINDKQLEELRQRFIHQPERTEDSKRVMLNLSEEGLRKAFIGAYEGAFEQVCAYSAKKGVSCFSEVNDNLLLWSHYGGKHKGFCLEFSTVFQPFHKVFKINYTDELPTFDALSAYNLKSKGNDLEVIEKFFGTKSSDWSYEKEWRCVHNEASKPYRYETNALTGVYFGSEMSMECKEIVILILRGQNKHVKYWQGRRSNERFKIEFDEIKSYHPHLEAIELGLKK